MYLGAKIDKKNNLLCIFAKKIESRLKKMRIYLVGYMGAGKSTNAKRLANKLGWEAYDTDRLFEERYKITIPDFFQKYDEPLFRRLESQILHDTLAFDNAVIATGGGMPCFNDNMAWMNQHGFTVFLKVGYETAYNRLINSKVKRPLVCNRTPEDIMAFIQANYTERLPFYEQAQLTFKGENCDVDTLATLIPRE